MKLVSESLGVSRSQLTARTNRAPKAPRPRRQWTLDDAALVDRIRSTISDLPSYGYRQVGSLLRRQAKQQAKPAQTRGFAREIGLLPLTTPICSPQSNGMAESFVKTMKRDYIAHMPRPDRLTALRNLEFV